jgi:hypothetical protein
MKTGRVFGFIIAASISLVALSLTSRPAMAQCSGDTPTGDIMKITCYSDDARYSSSVGGASVSSGINGYLALRFPVLSAAAWWMSRHMSVAGTAASARPASSADALAATRRRFGN